MKKRVKLAVVMAVVTAITNISTYASNINVRLEGLTKTNEVTNVNFEYAEPLTIDGVSMVPIRTVCEDAGMSVMWQKSVNAVVVALDAEAASSMPVKQYAYNILNKKADAEGRKLNPERILMTMYVNSKEAMLHYNYKDDENKIVSYGKLLNLPKEVSMVKDGALVAPLRTVFNQLGLWVEWDVSGKIVVRIPDFVNFTDGLKVFESYEPQAEHQAVVTQTVAVKQPPMQSLVLGVSNGIQMFTNPEPVVSDVQPVSESKSSEKGKGTYLGNFKITHYCACEKCCGPYGGQTAWGGPLKPGYSIAVDPSVIGKLSKVIIDGYGLRVAEDCGGAIKGNRIDIAVESHEEALRLGVVYKDVWLAE